MIDNNGKRPVPEELAKAAAKVIARQWLKEDAVSMTDSDRITVARKARAKAKWAAKRLEWMRNPERQHGQQAKEYGQKTIRGLLNDSLNADQFFDRCKEFGRLRKGHIDRNNSKKPRAEARSLTLPHYNMSARWLISDSQINVVGQAMANCLANKEFAKDYKSRLRLGSIELVVLENQDGGYQALISVDPLENCVEQVQGPGNLRPIDCRDAIIALLTHRNAAVGECHDLLSIGICDDLLAGRANGANVSFLVGKRNCEVGSGFVTIVWGDNTVLIRSEGCKSWRSEVCIVGPDSDDIDYLKQAKTRVWLREACRKNVEFAQACWAAFENAPRAFCLDWLGAVRTRK